MLSLMKIIDVRTGKTVEIGKKLVYDSGVSYMFEPGNNPNELTVRRMSKEEPSWYKIIKIQDRVFTARALVEGNKMIKQWVPLRVRVTHPAFMLQRIAFVPT